MAASANPSGDNNNQNEGGGAGGVSNGNGPTCNSIPVPDNSAVGPTQAALKHNPGLSVEWSPDEQTLLHDLLTKYVHPPLSPLSLSLCLSFCLIVWLYMHIPILEFVF